VDIAPAPPNYYADISVAPDRTRLAYTTQSKGSQDLVQLKSEMIYVAWTIISSQKLNWQANERRVGFHTGRPSNEVFLMILPGPEGF